MMKKQLIVLGGLVLILGAVYSMYRSGLGAQLGNPFPDLNPPTLRSAFPPPLTAPPPQLPHPPVMPGGSSSSMPNTEFGYCSDSMDNDGDGNIDCSDADCSQDPVCTPTLSSAASSASSLSSVSSSAPRIIWRCCYRVRFFAHYERKWFQNECPKNAWPDWKDVTAVNKTQPERYCGAEPTPDIQRIPGPGTTPEF